MKQTRNSRSRFLQTFLAIALTLALPITATAADSGAAVTGTVAEVQKYGNLTMDIKPKILFDAGYELGDVLSVDANGQTLSMPFCTSYSDVDTGSLLVRDDKKNDLLVVAINMGNFAKTYGVQVGDSISFSLREKQGYLSEYLLHQLKRSNIRSDYPTDSIFANFRSIATTGIKPGVVYRSSSPVNDELGRAAYADRLARAVGIKTVLNFADSDKEIAGFFAAKGFNSTYYKSLYEAGKVKALNMGVDIGGADFGVKLADGIRFLLKNDGPFLIHCTEGKDRAGFVSALFESFMGSPLDEIISDYMTTYTNYYGIEKGGDQYSAIANSNIIASLTMYVCGLPKGSDLSKTDLAAAATGYLAKIGLSADEISALKVKLSADSTYVKPYVTGSVTGIEKYGHAVTDISIDAFNAKGFKMGDMVTTVFSNGFVLEAPYLDGYYVNKGDPLVRAYPGQTKIALCINYGKLKEIAGVKVSDKVAIMLSAPGAYLSQYEIRKLIRSNKRTDYTSDAVFANFRALKMGDIAGDVLYRSASPVNNELGRAAYADKLAKEAGVRTVVNLADSKEAIDSFIAAKDFASPYYSELYKSGHVVALNMGLAFSSDEFRSGIIKGLQFMAANPGPYLFHCTEGKDRTGFFAALIESLMGASKSDIVKDYMVSYANFYGAKEDTEQYRLISQDLLGMLQVIVGTGNLAKEDLAAGAERYLTQGGMTASQIAMLKAKLSEGSTAVGTYTVVKGDCLWNIAKAQLGDGHRYTEIYKLNKAAINNPDLIHIGQRLALPFK